MDNPVNQIQDTIRQMWYSETNSGESAFQNSKWFQTCINLVPTFVHDTFLPYGRPREQVLEKRDGLTNLVTSAGAKLQWASFLGANAPDVVILDAITITAVYDVVVVACYDPVGNANYIVQVRPYTGTALTIGSPAIAKGDQLYLTEISQVVSGNLVPAIAVNQMKSDKTVGAGYYAVTTSGVFTSSSLTTITDTGFPANQTPALIPTGRFKQLNGISYIASVDGQIWNSSTFPFNDISIWKDANGDLMNASANFYPDQLIGIERYKNHIVAFGTNSIEFFDDQGNTPSPLGVLDQSTIKFGALAATTIKNLNDQLYWVAYGTEGVTGVWTLDGYTPTKISTPYLDFFIAQQIGQNGLTGLSLVGGTINSRAHIILNGITTYSVLDVMNTAQFSNTDTYAITPSANDGVSSIQCFNVVDQTWWGFNMYSVDGGSIFPVSSFPSPAVGTTFYTQYVFLSGNALSVRPDYVYSFANLAIGPYGDIASGTGIFPGNISAISCYVQCNPLWFTNEKRKRVSKFKIIRDAFIPNSADSNVYSGYLLYSRDNDMLISGGAFESVFVRQMPVQSSAPFRYYVNNLGTGRMWTFGYLEKTLSNLRIHSYEMDVTQNSH